MTTDKKKQISKKTKPSFKTASDIEANVEIISTEKKSPFKLLRKYSIILTAVIGLLLLIFYQNPNFKVDWNDLLSSFYKVWEKDFDVGNNDDDMKSGVFPESEQKVTIEGKQNTTLSKEVLTLKVIVGDLKQRVLGLESYNKLTGELNPTVKVDEIIYEGKDVREKKVREERQEYLDKIMAPLVDRLAILEIKENNKLLYKDDLKKVFGAQDAFKRDINNRIDLLSKMIDTQLSKHPPAFEPSSLMIFSVSQIAGAILQNKPFHIHLESLRLISAKNANVEKHINQLAKHATKGVLSYNVLEKRLKIIQENLSKMQNLPNKDLIGGVVSQIKSLVKIRKIKNLKDGSLEAIVASAYANLQNNNLRLAIEIISNSDNRLNDNLKKWLRQATDRLLVEEAISNLEAIALSNLSNRE